MYYFGEELGQTWMRDHSAYHKAQRRHPFCGTKVIITDKELPEYGRKGIVAKVTESNPIYMVTLNQWDGGEEWIYADKWQFRTIESAEE